MTTLHTTARRSRCEQTLRALGDRARCVAPLSWQVATGAEGRMLRVQAEDDWLQLESVLDREVGGGAGTVFPRWQMLMRLNGHQGVGVRFVLDRERRYALRAELVLRGNRSLEERFLSLCGDLEESVRRYEDLRTGRSAGEETPRSADSTPAPTTEWEEAAQECGWPLSRQENGELQAELEVPTGFGPGRFEFRGDHAARVWVELVSLENAGEESRAAVALMLLLGGGVLRLVRPLFALRAGRLGALLEAGLPRVAAPADLADVLSGLSLGVGLLGEPVRALLDTAVARHYLAVVGGIGQGTDAPR
jgi:hypothetical protein